MKFQVEFHYSILPRYEESKFELINLWEVLNFLSIVVFFVQNKSRLISLRVIYYLREVMLRSMLQNDIYRYKKTYMDILRCNVHLRHYYCE